MKPDGVAPNPKSCPFVFYQVSRPVLKPLSFDTDKRLSLTSLNEKAIVKSECVTNLIGSRARHFSLKPKSLMAA